MQVGRRYTMNSRFSTAYYMAEHAYCVESSDGAIILDVRSGSYLALDLSSLAILRTYIIDWPRSVLVRVSELHEVKTNANPLISELLRRGFVTAEQPDHHRPSHVVPTSSSMPSDRKAPVNGSTLLRGIRFILSTLQVRLCYRRNRIEPFLKWLVVHQSGVRSRPYRGAAQSELLAAFCRMRIWIYTAREQCLLDSMILTVFLTRSRVPCQFVIGVTAKPFSAHAWVQIGDAVANDVIDHVQEYLPILWT